MCTAALTWEEYDAKTPGLASLHHSTLLTAPHFLPADGRPRTKASMMAHCKPPMAVPSFIISFILKGMTPFVYSQMQKVLHSAFSDPTNVLPQRVQGKPELYQLVTQRVAANAHLMRQD